MAVKTKTNPPILPSETAVMAVTQISKEELERLQLLEKTLVAVALVFDSEHARAICAGAGTFLHVIYRRLGKEGTLAFVNELLRSLEEVDRISVSEETDDEDGV